METGIDKEALNKIPMGILVLDGRDLDHIVFASHMAGKQGNETGDETGTK